MSVYEDSMDSEALLTRMRTLNKKFKNACSQVILLNNQIEYLQVRYDRAVKANKRSYRYFLRLRLATLEGIRNMFYEYACRKADQLDEMQDQLVQEGVIDSDYDMDDDADDLYTIADHAQVVTAQTASNSHDALVYGSSVDINSVTVHVSANSHSNGSVYDSVEGESHSAPIQSTSSGASRVTFQGGEEHFVDQIHTNIHEERNTVEGEIVQESQTNVQESDTNSDLLEANDLGISNQSESLFQQHNSLNTPPAAFVELFSGGILNNEANSVLTGENNQQHTVLTGEKSQALIINNTVLPSSPGSSNGQNNNNSTLLAGSSRGTGITEDIQRQTESVSLDSQSDSEEYTVQAKAARIDTEENMYTI